MSRYWNLSAPITVHVELTEGCNEKCRHCYNFSRADDYDYKNISEDHLKKTIDELIKNKVMHVIITGGEPTLVHKKVKMLVEACVEAGISFSLNSNMKLVSMARLKEMKGWGIHHILTTLHSHKVSVHDYITGVVGSFWSTVKNIQKAQEQGIRITVNTILSDYNKKDIYNIGTFAKSIGVQKFLANRTIPSPSNKISLEPSYTATPKDMQRMFNDLLRLKKDYGMQVGTCRTVPMCFFTDLEEYSAFTDRGCAAGKKHLVLDVGGNARACVSENKTYGNIHKIGIKGVWENMKVWRSLDYIPDGCQSCGLFDRCDAGCRLVALRHTSQMNGVDNLCKGPKEAGEKTNIINSRQEHGFHIVRKQGAKVIFVDDPK